LASFAAIAAAQDRPPYGAPIGIEQAKRIATSALAEAQKNKWRVAIADTQTGSVQVAIDKAKTAAMFRRPTKVIGGIGVSGVNADQDAQVAPGRPERAEVSPSERKVRGREALFIFILQS
jgi:uncharacterized protein GlcG (DUF336 family)